MKQITAPHTIVFDFDGIFTDNFVFTDSRGRELVRSSRSDSYALKLFRDFLVANNLKVDIFILSTETSKVVKKRAKKLGLKAHTGVSDKKEYLIKYLEQNERSYPEGLIYMGNDLNDLECFQISQLTFAPADSHPKILKIATHPLKSEGGNGFVREALHLIQNSTKL